MAWYLDSYECSQCGAGWQDEWSCCCDDECPNCGASDHSPIESTDISAFTDKHDEGGYDIYYSPPHAGHDADYTLLATTTNRNLAIILEKMAYFLASPI